MGARRMNRAQRLFGSRSEDITVTSRSKSEQAENENRAMKILFLLTVIAFHQSIAQHLLSVYIRSEALDDPRVRPGTGALVRIRVNSEYYEEGKRGYNIVVVNGDTGAVEDSASFDTHESTEQADGLATFLNSLDPEKLVLVGVQDDASEKMTAAAYEALENIGAVDPLRSFRSSFALIGWTGFGGLSAVTQVQRERFDGPSIISEIISLPLST